MTENMAATVKVCRTEEMNKKYYGTLASTSYSTCTNVTQSGTVYLGLFNYNRTSLINEKGQSLKWILNVPHFIENGMLDIP